MPTFRDAKKSLNVVTKKNRCASKGAAPSFECEGWQGSTWGLVAYALEGATSQRELAADVKSLFTGLQTRVKPLVTFCFHIWDFEPKTDKI